MLESGLTLAMLGAKPKVWARHRWCSAERAVDQLGLLEAVHGLLTHTFANFMGRHGKSGQALAGHVQAVHLTGDDERGPPAPAGTCTASPEGPPMEQSAPPEAGHSTLISATDHARDRHEASQWLAANPFGYIVMMRTTMQPLKELMGRQFHVAGPDFEVERQAELCKKLKTGLQGPGLREFMATLAARCVLEQQFFESLESIMTRSPTWSLLPLHMHTVQTRSLAHRLLVRTGCLVHELQRAPHKRFPCRMFQLLHRPEAAAEVLQTEECCLDPWSRAVKTKYPSLAGPEFFEMLLTHCHTISTNTSPVEARHASIRRQLTSRVQTWAEQLQLTSSQHLLQTLRTRGLQGKRRSVKTAGPKKGSSGQVRCWDTLPPPTPQGTGRLDRQL